MDAVEHARNINPAIKEQYIARGNLVVGDGLIMATPTRPQPEHHTLWSDIQTNLPAKFEVLLNPVDEE